MWWDETWRSWKVFNIDQAWRANFPERPLVRDPTRRAVLLVHGYMCNRAIWRHWLLNGIPQHWNVATVNLEPVFGPVERYAEVIHGAVERCAPPRAPTASPWSATAWAVSPRASTCAAMDAARCSA